MEFRVQVFWSSDLPDGRATELLNRLERLDVPPVHHVRISDLYFLRGDLSAADLSRLAVELLVDPIVEGYYLQPSHAPPRDEGPQS